jgi:hypothetical protein
VSGTESDRHLLVAQLIDGAPVVWIGVVDAAVEGLRLEVGGTAVGLPDAWETFTGGGRTLRSQRVPVAGRPPRAAIAVQLMDAGGAILATTTLTTMPTALPSPVERPFTILFGSCFAGARDTPGDAGATFARLPPDARPDLTLLCGDQVYLDTPLLHWLTRTHPPEELAAEFLTNYLGTWTQSGPLSGFRRIHQLASVAFTSDDHDYWNNAPSIAPHVIDTWTEHGRTAWLEAAHRLYRQFESTVAFQSIRVGPLSVFIADTRTARTGDRLSFMDVAQFEALRTWVHALPGPGVLVLGQPIFTAEAGLKGYVADWGLPDFHQYRDLVSVLASTPHDIAILTGDVHFGRVASCTLPGGRRLVELIASPLALVDGLVGGHWKPAPPVYPTVPVPAVPQVAVTTEGYQEIRNHAMTVGFTGVGASVRLTATGWPIRPCEPAVGTVVHTTELH